MNKKEKEKLKKEARKERAALKSAKATTKRSKKEAKDLGEGLLLALCITQLYYLLTHSQRTLILCYMLIKREKQEKSRLQLQQLTSQVRVQTSR